MKLYIAVVLTVLFVTSTNSASPRKKDSAKAQDLLAILKKLSKPESQTRSSRTSPLRVCEPGESYSRRHDPCKECVCGDDGFPTDDCTERLCDLFTCPAGQRVQEIYGTCCGQECVPITEYCLGEGGNHKVGETFPLVDGCYVCSFDHDCHLSCTPNTGGCTEHIKTCKDDDEYYPINQHIREPGGGYFCYDLFDENCYKMRTCSRPVPGTTCTYNGRSYPKEVKLWHMEDDPSCYMYFEENCDRFSRCELGGGIFYCQYQGRFRKVGEWFDDPDERNVWYKFDERCDMSSRGVSIPEKL